MLAFTHLAVGIRGPPLEQSAAEVKVGHSNGDMSQVLIDHRQGKALALACLAVGIALAFDRGSLDWGLVTTAGHLLVHGGGLHTYDRDPALQAGPLGLALFAGLAALGTTGVVTAQLAMWGLGAWVIFTASSSRPHTRPDAPISRPAWLVGVVVLLPALTWHLPPVGAGQLLLWPVLAAAVAALAVLPSTRGTIRGDITLSRTQWVGLLLVGTWALLAAGSAHLEDAVAIAALAWVVRDTGRERGLRAAVVVGLAIAFKPWAVAGLAVLVRRDRPSRVLRDLAVAVAIPAALWLPFVLAAPGTLHAASRAFPVQAVTSVAALGLTPGAPAPAWLRSVELAGIVLASLTARRSGAADAVAAGMCARLLLDPSASGYYLSTALLAVGAADLTAGRPARRLTAGLVGLWLLPLLSTDLAAVAWLRTGVLLALLASYVVRARRPAKATPAIPEQRHELVSLQPA